jgi:hypothetical protein
MDFDSKLNRPRDRGEPASIGGKGALWNVLTSIPPTDGFRASGSKAPPSGSERRRAAIRLMPQRPKGA